MLKVKHRPLTFHPPHQVCLSADFVQELKRGDGFYLECNRGNIVLRHRSFDIEICRADKRVAVACEDSARPAMLRITLLRDLHPEQDGVSNVVRTKGHLANVDCCELTLDPPNIIMRMPGLQFWAGDRRTGGEQQQSCDGEFSLHLHVERPG